MHESDSNLLFKSVFEYPTGLQLADFIALSAPQIQLLMKTIINNHKNSRIQKQNFYSTLGLAWPTVIDGYPCFDINGERDTPLQHN